MTSPRDEQAQAGPGEFRDVVDVQVLDESLLVAARISRAPSDGSGSVMAVVLAEGEAAVEIDEELDAGVESWDHAVAGPLQLSVAEPLERWTLSLDAPAARVDLELRALTAPADLAEPATAGAARAAGLHRYTQLCEARGTAEIQGRRRTVEAVALRTHRWGPIAEAGRTRFLTAATDDGTLLTVAAVQPAGAEAHGEELVGGQTTRTDEEGDAAPLPFETVRLSTVFDQGGLPLTAGAELYRPGDELPSRLAGVAAGGVSAQLTGGRTSLTLFRFRLDGVPALGAYEVEAGA
jgi:hypothetical protein